MANQRRSAELIAACRARHRVTESWIHAENGIIPSDPLWQAATRAIEEFAWRSASLGAFDPITFRLVFYQRLFSGWSWISGGELLFVSPMFVECLPSFAELKNVWEIKRDKESFRRSCWRKISFYKDWCCSSFFYRSFLLGRMRIFFDGRRTMKS